MCLLPFPNYFHKDYISDYVVSEVADLLSWWSTSDLTEAPLNACSQKEVGGGREKKKGTKRERKKKQKKKKKKTSLLVFVAQHSFTRLTQVIHNSALSFSQPGFAEAVDLQHEFFNFEEARSSFHILCCLGFCFFRGQKVQFKRCICNSDHSSLVHRSTPLLIKPVVCSSQLGKANLLQ